MKHLNVFRRPRVQTHKTKVSKHFFMFFMFLALLLSKEMQLVAQTHGTIKGKVLEDDGKTPAEYANVALLQDGNFILGTTTDMQGLFTLNLDSVPYGKYDIRISSVGFEHYIIKDIEIKENTVKDIGNIQIRNRQDYIIYDGHPMKYYIGEKEIINK